MFTNGKQPTRILLYGDVAIPTGFGRIGAAVGRHLVSKGYNVLGACIQYDGVLPPPEPLPFHVCGLAGRDQGGVMFGFAQVVANIAGMFRPDVIISAQDFPYHAALRNVPIDWSVTAHLAITPVDGVPIFEDWLRTVDQFDGFMTISEFGVEAFRKAGKRAELCPPGVDLHTFRRLSDAERGALRDKLNIPRDAFVVGVMAMNQGRKDFPAMVSAFTEAYRDVPNAFLYLDCEKGSAAGWDIPKHLMAPMGLDTARVRFREDGRKAGLVDLNEGYNLCDIHMVIAHREGYGLPHGEAMATGIPTIAIDYCSGREIIGENERGWLVPATPTHPHAFGTWGGAIDYNVDMPALVKALREAYENPAERLARGARGLTWVKEHRTWERAALAVENLVQRIVEKRGVDLAKKWDVPVQVPPVQTMPAGMHMTQPPLMHFHNPTFIVQGENAQAVLADMATQASTVLDRVSLVESETNNG